MNAASFLLVFVVIFNLYSSDGVFVHKNSMESLILACDGGNIPEAITECFSQVWQSFGYYKRFATVVNVSTAMFKVLWHRL